MESATSTALVRELTIQATPETVWEFLVDEGKAASWMGTDVTLEPTPGGIYRVAVTPGHVASGAFVEVERPRRVVFTWGWEPGPDGEQPRVTPGSSRVEFTLEPSNGGTLLRLVHELPDAEAVEKHGVGWDHYLPRLVSAAAGVDPGPDAWATPSDATT